MMKKLFTLVALAVSITAYGQDSMEKTMDARAREMFRVITLNDPEAWKKFIRENYTKALIEKPMQARRDTGSGGGGTTQPGTVEGKAKMYEMLHNDFGAGKVTSLTFAGQEAKMVITAYDLKGTFTLKFAKDKPWLIDGIGVEAGN
jgi:hypothetical protein